METSISKNTKNYLILSISLAVIFFTCIATVVAWILLDNTGQKLRETTAQYQTRTELVITLLDAARVRTMTLQHMLLEADPFSREESYMHHLAQGSRFLAARAQLEAMLLSDTEKTFLSNLDELLSITATNQEKLVQLAVDGHFDDARHLMNNSEYIDTRTELYDLFENILAFYRNKTTDSFVNINRVSMDELRHILMLTALIIIISTFIGFFMMFKSSRSDRMLRMEVSRRMAAQKELLKQRNELEQSVADKIEKYKQKEAEFNLSRDLSITMGQIMEDSINEIYIFDAESYKFIQVNHGARSNLGYSMEELKQMRPLDLKPEIKADEFEEKLNLLRKGVEKTAVIKTTHLRKNRTTYPVEVHLQLSLMGAKQVFIAMALDITRRLQAQEKLELKSMEIERAHNELQHQKMALDNHAIVSIANQDETVAHVNEKFIEISQFNEDELIGGHFCIGMSDEQPEEFFVELSSTIQSGKVWDGVICNNKKDGTPYWTNTTITPFIDNNGDIYRFVVISTDITAQKLAEREIRDKSVEIELANEELKNTRSQALHAEKLASVGQLAAGIAHEINTPIQFVGDNTRFLQEAFEDVFSLLDTYAEQSKAVIDGSAEAVEIASRAEAQRKDIDIDYISEEVPTAIKQSLEGVERVTKIVRSMKDFSHPGSDQKEAVNLARSIESTIIVSRNEWKYIAEIDTDFDDSLTSVPCFPGELNQVILNMIVNASHAIEDTRAEGSEELGRISISTKRMDDYAEIRIGDSGTGMPEDVRKRIFEPFFTTKGVGKGSGQGLAIAYSVIVEKHKGSIDVESEPGKGTTFIIHLPLANDKDKENETETEIKPVSTDMDIGTDNDRDIDDDNEKYTVCR